MSVSWVSVIVMVVLVRMTGLITGVDPESGGTVQRLLAQQESLIQPGLSFINSSGLGGVTRYCVGDTDTDDDDDDNDDDNDNDDDDNDQVQCGGHPQLHPDQLSRVRHHQHCQLVQVAPRIPSLLLQIWKLQTW